MKHQALFSLQDKSKKKKLSYAVIFLGSLRVNESDIKDCGCLVLYTCIFLMFNVTH